jgi:hypothetical protein
MCADYIMAFCEKRKKLKTMDCECWSCEENVINGGYCYPWPPRELTGFALF